MSHQTFKISKRIMSFKYAFNGLQVLFSEEHNSRIHLVVAIGVIILAKFLNVSLIDWALLAFAIGLVFVLEIVNSSIENMADIITTERHPSIKKVKDLGAASVLVGAITAVIIGLCVFVPKIIELL